MPRADAARRQERLSAPIALTGMLSLFLLAGLALPGCGGKKDQAASATPTAGQPAPGATGTDGAPVQPPPPVAVTPATVGPIASHYATTATLEAEKEAEVLARVAGVVKSLACEEGDFVREGQALLTIENDEYRLRVDQMAARRAELAARFARVRDMMTQQLVTEEEFQKAKADLAGAEADEGLARLNYSYTTVTAPFAGRVVRRLANVGQNLAIGAPLFGLADMEPLLARVHVPSKEFRKLQPDQPVELVLDSTDERFTGRIKLVSPIIDPQSGTIKVTVEVATYPAGTRPGDFARVRIVTDQRPAATLVPKLAVFTEKGEDILFVAKDGLAERRSVTLGFTDDDRAEITAGVQPGELVVVKGQRSLKQGAPLKILADEPAASPEPVTKRTGS